MALEPHYTGKHPMFQPGAKSLLPPKELPKRVLILPKRPERVPHGAGPGADLETGGRAEVRGTSLCDAHPHQQEGNSEGLMFGFKRINAFWRLVLSYLLLLNPLLGKTSPKEHQLALVGFRKGFAKSFFFFFFSGSVLLMTHVGLQMALQNNTKVHLSSRLFAGVDFIRHTGVVMLPGRLHSCRSNLVGSL